VLARNLTQVHFKHGFSRERNFNQNTHKGGSGDVEATPPYFYKIRWGLKRLRAVIPIKHRLCVNLLRWGLKHSLLVSFGYMFFGVNLPRWGIKSVQTLLCQSFPASWRIKFLIMSASADVLTLKSGAYKRSGGPAAR